jgi:excinuclease ABC subunit B
VFAQGSVLDIRGYDPSDPHANPDGVVAATSVAEEQATYKTIPQIEKAIAKTKKDMEQAARDMDFMEAARLRDEMFRMKEQLEQMKGG